MKRFLYHLSIFALGLLVLNGAAYVMVYRIDFKEVKDYVKADLDFDTFLLSDSQGRVLEMVTEQYGVYNFSWNNESYVDMGRKLKYLARNTRLSRIIVGVPDYAILNYREQYNNNDKSVYFTTFRLEKNKVEFLRDRYLKRYVVLLNARSRDILLGSFREKMKSLVSGPAQPPKKWAEVSDGERREHALTRAEEQYADSTVSVRLEQALEEMITFCRENNIELAGIKFPLTQVYINTLGEKDPGAERILRRQQIPVYDYTHLYETRKELFRDQDHLNPEGAELFVRVLSGEVF